MTKRPSLLIALFAAGLVSVGSAAAENGPFGSEVLSLDMTDVMIDAARSFEKIDGNRDGVIDEDEYAARRIVFAQLSRFKGHVVVDGQHTVHVALPEHLQGQMTASERSALETVARRDHQLRAMGAAGLDQSAWQDSALEAFALADLDGDGALVADELAAFAGYRAGSLTAGLPAS